MARSKRRKSTPHRPRRRPPNTLRSQHPGGSVNNLLAQAKQARQAGKLKETTQLYHILAGQFGPQPKLILQSARELETQGFIADATLLLRAWTTRHPGNQAVELVLANLLFESAQAADALQITLTVLQTTNPEAVNSNTAAHCLAAACYEQLNQAAAARTHLQQALHQNPEDPQAGIMLAHWERQAGETTAAVRRLQKILGDASLPPQIQRKGYHELGMTLNQRGRYAEAFAAFTRCGEVTRPEIDAQLLNPRRSLNRMLRYRNTIDRDYFQPLQQQVQSLADQQPPPVFLVGFPRSGTTLTEQVLRAHPAVTTADEQPFLHETRAEAHRLTDSGNDNALMLPRLDRSILRQVRGFYRRLIHAGTNPTKNGETPIIIDKLPLNLMDLPFINAIFPDAKVIVALRDPRAVCLSCLMQDFRLNAEMAHFLSIEDTAKFYARVMGFYLDLRPCFTLPLLEIRYEDTVTNLEQQARRLLSFLELEWDPAVLQFHTKAREHVISTPSFAAVREPIHHRAVAHWHHYAEHLKTAEASLQRFVNAFNYAED